MNEQQHQTPSRSLPSTTQHVDSAGLERLIATDTNSRARQNRIDRLQVGINPSSMSKEKAQCRPWFTWILSIAQICVFIGELIQNWILTGTPIETDLSKNPLFGPSPFVLINMGASFSPCTHSISGITDNLNSTGFPCPSSTTVINTNCTLSDLCGFNGISNVPNQWYRFILPIFLHAGIIHIGINLFTQIIIVGVIERQIGVLRIAVIYLTSGIFGFILGGNFGAQGLARVGCSGSLCGIFALSLLDVLYNSKTRKDLIRGLIFHIIDIIVNFVLGLLPGIDNFSHVGGFCMGILLGLGILGSPKNFRRCKKTRKFNAEINERFMSHSCRKFFHNRPKIWWIWWLIRSLTLAIAITLFVILIENFYSRRIKCRWCQYISCLPVRGWCDIGKFNTTTT